ncbi:MAG TPA: hypothetical protein VF950_15560 [Planctomycetota bacterium]
MLRLFSWIWGCSPDSQVLDDPEALRSEIKHLDDMIADYRAFGYEDMAQECMQRKHMLEKELGRLQRK